MTKKSMEDLLAKLTAEQKHAIAANQPVYGEISYDRAVNELFEKNEDVVEENKDAAKGLALLYRAELKKTDDMKQDEILTNEIQQYVQKLLQEMPAFKTDYKEFYDARESPD